MPDGHVPVIISVYGGEGQLTILYPIGYNI